MSMLKLFLTLILFLIYAVLAATVLYFPAGELLFYIGREMRLFNYRPTVPIEDSLLPLLALALIYAAVAKLLRKLEQAEALEKGSPSSGNE